MKKVGLLFLLAGLFQLNACKDNPVKDDHGDHEEAVGFVLTGSGVEIVRYENGVVTGSVTIAEGEETPLLSVKFIAEDGDLFVPESADNSLSIEIEDKTIVAFEQHAEDGKYSFHLHGEKAGSTTFRVVLNHNDHADFRSLPIPVTVTASN